MHFHIEYIASPRIDDKTLIITDPMLATGASVMDYVEHTMSVGTDAMAASYVECQVGEADDAQIVWGVGIDSSITTSALKSIISAINRSQRKR